MVNKSPKAYIETLGCQMNKADSENILGILHSIGYNPAKSAKEAVLLIINTCTIRQLAEDKAFSHLGVWGKMKKTRPDLIIAVCGCVAQQQKELIFKRAPYVDLIFGTHNINELPRLIKEHQENKKSKCSILNKPYEGIGVEFKAIRDSNLAAWINIIEGCDYFCTYCVVPYVRGRQRSRPFDEIVKEVEQLADYGYKEITLLGQTVDSYGKDLKDNKADLPALLERLSQIDNLKRIRFVTSHPVDITDELIETVSRIDKICEYFHIPMQSGDTAILERMRRGYTSEEYYKLVAKIREKIDGVGITSDFIVAFPGETDVQFQNTIMAVDELVFDQCNTAMYSPRKQTPAATWRTEQLPKQVKKDRINILNKHVRQAAFKANQKLLGSTQEILVESYSEKDGAVILTGRTRNNKITHFKGDVSIIGELVNIKITEASPWSLRGELANINLFSRCEGT